MTDYMTTLAALAGVNQPRQNGAPKEDRKIMGFAVTATNGGDFKNPTPGMVSAVCTRIVDMGTQETSYGDKRQVMLTFEIDEEMDDGRRFLVNNLFTLSFHEKSSLRQSIESWRGRAFKEGEPFDLSAIVGKPAMLNLVETDKGYVNIKSISPLAKGMPALEPAGDLIVFSLDSPDWDAFDKLSERLRDKISNSREYKLTEENARGPVAEAATAAAGEFDDDIPF